MAVPGVECRPVILTGAGAVWMYAHAAASLAAAGAARLQVHSPQPDGTSNDLSHSHCELRLLDDNRAAVVSVHLQRSPDLSPSAIDRLLQPCLDQLRQRQLREVCLTGRASTGAYARLAWECIRAGVGRLLCLSARDGLVVVFENEPLNNRVAWSDWLEQAMPRPGHPVVIGIIGDPNRGKSVFSLALERYRASKGCSGWLLDCDGQSLTPPWYIRLLGNDPQQARQLRENIKRPWTSEMEEQIARQIETGRRFFEVLLTDLPGGNHKVQPPQRLPPGRERMFAGVDGLILLDGPEGQSETAWREELRRHGLENRLVAMLTSCRPEALPALVVYPGSPWRGVVQGLDRNRSEAELDQAFRQGFDQLWPVLRSYPSFCQQS
jgi:hypothetical protein